MNVPVREVHWNPCWRLIATRYMEKRVLLKLADEEDLEALSRLDGMTNERLRQERGEISAIPPEERVSGKGSEFIMAPFLYTNPEGSRFSDGAYGVYYGSRALDTAVEELTHHTAVFMSRTKQPPMRLEKRAVRACLSGKLHDTRGKRLPEVCSTDDYAASQALGRRLKEAGSNGIVFDSVRQRGGECAAVFRPPVLSRCRVGSDWIFEWDGEKVAKVYMLREYQSK